MKNRSKVKMRLINFVAHVTGVVLTIVLGLGALSSCESSAEYKREVEKLNACYTKYDEHERIRHEARQERTDMWFGRMMGKPPAGDSGLKMPDDPDD